jgi:hypothetical protein
MCPERLWRGQPCLLGVADVDGLARASLPVLDFRERVLFARRSV